MACTSSVSNSATDRSSAVVSFFVAVSVLATAQSFPAHTPTCKMQDLVDESEEIGILVSWLTLTEDTLLVRAICFQLVRHEDIDG
eukprot:CAMPEP_0194436486 /NCGR_PEP_ID=MMETSP0176-20130528/94903_1 /TAXON_ID=216777 /ORGANISM="Proboscia alata, Strain PI-D3" /LENGTH=84 /DNA_ID=CAMNT_0039256875 /DNA_START=151 /DNA_END=405 /DNA_ORIENTATION=-